MDIDPERVTITEEVDGSDIPLELKYLETWDGLYAPYRSPTSQRARPTSPRAARLGQRGPWHALDP